MAGGPERKINYGAASGGGRRAARTGAVQWQKAVAKTLVARVECALRIRGARSLEVATPGDQHGVDSVAVYAGCAIS